MKRILIRPFCGDPGTRLVIFMIFISLVLGINKLDAQDDYDVITGKWLKYSDAPNSLYNYLAQQAYVLLGKRDKEIAGLNSLPDWQTRQKWIRETLLDVVGPFPLKTPLNPKITRIVRKDGFRMEHIVFESQPGFFVTSTLFIPTGLKAKAPAIIYCSGHSADGYRNPVYQEVIRNLVSKGFIVFAFDPIGQGERIEYDDPEIETSIFGEPDKEHSYCGSQVFITGSSLARYMIWDGIRAIDYLVTRKEVDTARIGITGRSGGGTQSAYIAAMDDRIYAAAPECYITNFTRLFQTIGNQDAEQNFFHGISRELDQPDLLLVRAPKPALLITTTRDMFSIQGAMETEQEVKKIYKAYQKEGNFYRVEDNAAHESTSKNREAMYAFFQKYLDNPGNPGDKTYNIMTKEEMQVTPTGQVSSSCKCETVFSLNLKESEKLTSKLHDSGKNNLSKIADAVNSAERLSGYEATKFTDIPVFTGRIQRDGYVIEKYFVKGEGEYVIPYLLMKPGVSNNKAILYLHPSGKSAEADTGGEMEWFVQHGFTVLAPDLIGTGETGPGIFKGDSYIDSVSHNLWYASILIGRSIVGIRAGDVVRLSCIFRDYPGINEIWGIARKEMTPVLVYAAAFDTIIRRIALLEPCVSYKSLVTTRYYKSSFVYGAVAGSLAWYDIPDLLASLAPRKLLVLGTTDGNGKILDLESINSELSITRDSYRNCNAEKQLDIKALEPPGKLSDFFSEWIK